MTEFKPSSQVSDESYTRRPNLVCVGRFGSPHGIRGEVRLMSFCAEINAIEGYCPLCTLDGSRWFEFRIVGRRKKMLVANVVGVNDRNGAQELSGIELYADRARFESTPKDEYYVVDLIGLEVRDWAGARIGVVKNVQNQPVGDLVELSLADFDDSLLAPFTKERFPKICLQEGFLVFVPPAANP